MTAVVGLGCPNPCPRRMQLYILCTVHSNSRRPGSAFPAPLGTSRFAKAINDGFKTMISAEHGDVDNNQSALHTLVPYPTSGSRKLRTIVLAGVGAKDDQEDMASWAGQPAVKGSTESMRMLLLTFSLIGLQ
jgi:hypothetical protein